MNYTYFTKQRVKDRLAVGKKRTVYALTLVEFREKEKWIGRDLQDGIDTSKAVITLNQLFLVYMGHVNISVTLNVYAHLDFTQIQEKMETILILSIL